MRKDCALGKDENQDQFYLRTPFGTTLTNVYPALFSSMILKLCSYFCII